MGYVYLIEDESNKTYKIGVTRNNDSTRIKKLQTGNSTALKLLYIFRTPYPFRLESVLHKRYADYKILNEWYELPEEVVNNFQDICTEANKMILSLCDNPFFGKNLK